MSIEIDYTGWKFFKDLFREYEEKGYYLYDHGYYEVEVTRIKGLSYKGVLSEEKLERLYKSIKENGYKYERFRDINLFRFPNGIYSVCEGGNHRPYLAKKLGIKYIMAQYCIVIPKEWLTQDQIEICESIEIGDLTNPKLKQICSDLRLLPNQAPLKVNIR